MFFFTVTNIEWFWLNPHNKHQKQQQKTVTATTKKLNNNIKLALAIFWSSINWLNDDNNYIVTEYNKKRLMLVKCRHNIDFSRILVSDFGFIAFKLRLFDIVRESINNCGYFKRQSICNRTTSRFSDSIFVPQILVCFDSLLVWFKTLTT